MKIAIKANPDRGEEIIYLLKSLGGINSKDRKGDGNLYTYYIDKDNKIQYDRAPKDYKVYTLEEFEKEFPFRVGDKVIDHEGDVAIITGFAYIEEKLGYSLQYENGRGTATSGILKPYKEMKKERNIKLTFDKAKEWYKKGGELKEIALQAFTEKELTKIDLPKTFEEFCNNCPIKIGEYYIDSCSFINKYESNESRNIKIDKNVCPSKQSAEAHLALIQLEQLRDCYRGLFVTVTGMPVWCIIRHNGMLVISPRTWGTNETFLSFQSKEAAEEYLKNFKPLIEKAGDLI